MKFVTFMAEDGKIFYVNPESIATLQYGEGMKGQKGTYIFFSGSADDHVFTPLGIVAVADKLVEQL